LQNIFSRKCVWIKPANRFLEINRRLAQELLRQKKLNESTLLQILSHCQQNHLNLGQTLVQKRLLNMADLVRLMKEITASEAKLGIVSVPDAKKKTERPSSSKTPTPKPSKSAISAEILSDDESGSPIAPPPMPSPVPSSYETLSDTGLEAPGSSNPASELATPLAEPANLDTSAPEFSGYEIV